MHDFITGLPKVELHLHIEGTLEPELMFALAKRNQIAIPFASPEAVRQAINLSICSRFLIFIIKVLMCCCMSRTFRLDLGLFAALSAR